MQPAHKTIKRYENRKLYDPTARRYVRLDEISAMIRDGCEITVIDNASGEDVTASTLAKIMSEPDRTTGQTLPAEMLTDLVRWGGRIVTVSRDQVERQLERLVDAALQRTDTVRDARDSMAELKARVEQLETQIGELLRTRSVSQAMPPSGATRVRRQAANRTRPEARLRRKGERP
jgi:polyhydroxyalkanoate synthesis repressor PhaR